MDNAAALPLKAADTAAENTKKSVRWGYKHNGIFALSAAAAFIPGTAINLCMMKDMACHTAFKPAAIVISVLLAVLSLADVIAGFVLIGKKRSQ